MKAYIDIDNRLLQKAKLVSGNRTKKATVEAGLRVLIEIGAQTSIRKLRRKVQWEGIASDRPRNGPRKRVRSRAGKTGKDTASRGCGKSRQQR